MSSKEKRDKSSDSTSSGTSSNSSGGDTKDSKPSNDVVLTKYNMAAEIVNNVLKEVLAEVKSGADVTQLCKMGDTKVEERTQKAFKNQKDVPKGIAFPTCVSVNNCVCHFSPLSSETPMVLKDGDVVKIDLGAHIDGYIASVAHTVVVGASKENKVSGKKANVILAAYNAMEMVLRMLRPEKGFKNTEVSEHISKLASNYGTTPIENMLSHEMGRLKINGEKQIIQNPSDEQKSKIEKCTFENFEVYAVDLLISTGEGKAKTQDSRTTVYKKTDDFVYSLKMKASREFLSKATQKFGVMPFSLRLFDDEVKAKMGVLECEKHGLMQPYQVLYEKEGEIVAQFKTTAIIMPSGIFKITGFPLDTSLFDCDVKIEDENLLSLLRGQLKPKKKKPAAKKEEENDKKEAKPATKKSATKA
ncbi:metallopeptidase family m24 domain-containing protein [Ditylenchus destructor]|nr:metallopeptidase family m24 domain-containing protein [Ditylenchus destructor]